MSPPLTTDAVVARRRNAKNRFNLRNGCSSTFHDVIAST
jgi:hypothetical protein